MKLNLESTILTHEDMNRLFENYDEKANIAIKAENDRRSAICDIVKELQKQYPNGYVDFDKDNLPDFYDETMGEYQKVLFAKVEGNELYFIVDSQDYDENDMSMYWFIWHHYGTIDLEEFVWHLHNEVTILENKNLCERIQRTLINTKIDNFKTNLKEEFKDRCVFFRSVDSKIDDGADNEEDKYVMMDSYDVIIGTEHFNSVYYVRMYYGDVSGVIGYVDAELK